MADLEKIPSLRVDSHRTPNSWLTPTHISFIPHTSTSTSPSSSSSFSGRPTQDGLIWQSRRQRKGRYAPKDAHLHYPPHTSRPGDSAIGHPGTDHQHVLLSARLSHKRTRLKPGWYFDISWWLAFAFTLGSAIWVVNGMSLSIAFPGARNRVWTPTHGDHGHHAHHDGRGRKAETMS